MAAALKGAGATADETAETGPEARDQILQLLLRNAVRMEACCDSLARYAEPDAAGDTFMKAFLDWAGRATVRAYAHLDENGYETRPLDERQQRGAFCGRNYS